MIANILIAVGMIITLYYILIDLPSVSERPAIADWRQMPMFFGTVIFALEGTQLQTFCIKNRLLSVIFSPIVYSRQDCE
jgi:hypothetical protein